MSAQNNSLSRRDFVKATAVAAAALVAAPAAIEAAQPSVAKASVPTTPGTYTVSANLKVGIGTIPSIVVGTPYMTCLNDPNEGEGFPTTKATNNATLTVNSDGTTGTLVLNQTLNPCIELIKIGSAGQTTATVTATAATDYNDDGVPATRINGLSFSLADLTGTYVFTGCEEFAGYSLLWGTHEWDITLIVE